MDMIDIGMGVLFGANFIALGLLARCMITGDK